MRTYTELINEFAVKNAFTKQEMIDETSNEEFLNAASIEELKILRDGLGTFSFSYGKGSWLEYIKIVISKKIEEERERKLNELGI
jgi:hypothetical protein